MSKKANTFIWVLFVVGTLSILGLLVLEYTKGARERAELERIEISEEPREIVEEATETTTEAVTQPTTTVATTTPETTVYIPSAEELAWEVIDKGITGDDRKAYLGDRYEEVQKWIDENYVPPVNFVSTPNQPDVNYPSGGGVLTPSAGVNYYNGRMETYYNLPMGGVVDIMYSLGYSGEYWVRGDGVKMFGGYVMVACDFSEYPRGSIIETSLGTAIVCDTGSGGWGWTDIAVSW